MLKYWLWLASRRNLSPREQLAVLRHFGTPEAAYCAEKSALSEVEGLRSTASLEDKSLMEPEEILNECYRKQISILTYQDAAYPDRLRSIDDRQGVESALSAQLGHDADDRVDDHNATENAITQVAERQHDD